MKKKLFITLGVVGGLTALGVGGYFLKTKVLDKDKKPVNQIEQVDPGVSDNIEKFVATYKVDNNVFAVEVLEKNSLLTLEDEPTKEGYVFKCWAINGVEYPNILAYRLTEDVTIEAVFIAQYSVQFISENQEYHVSTYLEGETIVLPDNPTKEGATFVGWLENGVALIEDFSTYELKGNTTFVASFKEEADENVATMSLSGVDFVKWTTDDATYYAYDGETVPLYTTIQFNVSTVAYDDFTIEGGTATLVKENLSNSSDPTSVYSRTYEVAVMNDITITATKTPVEPGENEAVVYINGEYEQATNNPSNYIYNGSIVSTEESFVLRVMDYKTQSVNVTGGTITNIVEYKNGVNNTGKDYYITITSDELTIDIENKVTYASIFFDETDFKVVKLSKNVTWDSTELALENLEEVNNGDMIEIGNSVYILPLKDYTDVTISGLWNTESDGVFFGTVNKETVSLQLIA